MAQRIYDTKLIGGDTPGMHLEDGVLTLDAGVIVYGPMGGPKSPVREITGKGRVSIHDARRMTISGSIKGYVVDVTLLTVTDSANIDYHGIEGLTVTGDAIAREMELG